MKYISRNPEIMSGAPVIAGTRILISRVIFLLSEGYVLENIQEQYPHVSLEKLKGAIEELMEELDDEKL